MLTLKKEIIIYVGVYVYPLKLWIPFKKKIEEYIKSRDYGLNFKVEFGCDYVKVTLEGECKNIDLIKEIENLEPKLKEFVKDLIIKNREIFNEVLLYKEKCKDTKEFLEKLEKLSKKLIV
jgi:hypothetical protein